MQTARSRIGTLTAAAVLMLAGPCLAAQQTPVVDVRVDPRVELMSIIFALAGNPEYNRCRVPSYVRDMRKHFLPFKGHAVVQTARRLRRMRGVSYDAPMSLAVHVTDAASLKERVPFDPHPPGLDRRWRLREVRGFLEHARDFVTQSTFSAFVHEHRALYDTATARMQETLSQHGHLEWFDRFFGQRPGARFHVFLGMWNGPCCYGASLTTDTGQDLYCMLGVWVCDAKGEPQFPKSVLPTVVHEFAHSYVNPLVAKHAAQLEKPGKALFAKVAKQMRRQAYGNWHTMVHESVVRACVVRYRNANEGTLAALQEIQAQHRRGFAWTGKLATRLGDYENQRDTYPTFDAFMPQIVEFFRDYASKGE